MKQKIRFCMLLLFFASLCYQAAGQTAEDLFWSDPAWQLSAEVQVQRIVDEFRGSFRFPRSLRFNRLTRILAYNPEESIPALFEHLERTDIVPFSAGDHAHSVLINILHHRFHRQGLLGKEDLNRLQTILRRQISNYLETYKVIDRRLRSINFHLWGIEDRDMNFMRTIWAMSFTDLARYLLEKYTRMGYNLRIDYVDLGIRRPEL